MRRVGRKKADEEIAWKWGEGKRMKLWQRGEVNEKKTATLQEEKRDPFFDSLKTYQFSPAPICNK